MLGDLRLTDGRNRPCRGGDRDRRPPHNLPPPSVRKYVSECGAYCAARGMNHLMVPSDADLKRPPDADARQRGVLR